MSGLIFQPSKKLLILYLGSHGTNVITRETLAEQILWLYPITALLYPSSDWTELKSSWTC
jgi:hypothetical protein